MTIEIALALSQKEKKDSFWVRHEVFAKEGKWIPENKEQQEKDKYDDSKYAYHLVAYDDDKPVGTVRVLMYDPHLAKKDATAGGLHIEKSFHIEYPGSSVKKVVDLSRSSVIKSHRSKNVLAGLYAKAVKLCDDHGIEQILGGANPSTDCLHQSRLMLDLAKASGRYCSSITLHPRCDTREGTPDSPYYSKEQVFEYEQALDNNSAKAYSSKIFPPVLRIVTSKFGFTFCGKPAYDKTVNMCSVPMNLSVADGKSNSFLQEVDDELPPLRNYG